MYKFSNLHPYKKLVGDCVKRALAAAEDISYDEISRQLNRLKREIGCKKFNEKINWKEYIRRKGWQKISFPAECGKSCMNGVRFMKEYPTGIYVLQMARHLTVCKDSDILDTWDCTGKRVYAAWKVK